MTSYKNILFILAIAFLFTACTSEKKGNFTLNVTIKNLKKGVVYLQKEEGNKIIDLDSVAVNGESNFVLTTDIEEPILLYLKLQKKDGQEHFIPFFADQGVTKINTTLKGFSGDAKIKGSEQQAILDEYLKLMKGFKDKNLDLLKANFEAVKANDSILSDSLAKVSQRLLRLKYASTINFALNNKDSEVSPYLALNEMPNANVIYQDSIYNNLTPQVQASFYGEKLGKALADFKKAQDSIK